MPVDLTWEAITLQLHTPFRLAHGTSETRRAFWLRLPEDEGWGEGTIPPYYHVREEDMIQCWRQAAAKSEPLPDDPDEIEAWVGEAGPAPARAALDLALHDRIARRRGLPLHELLGLPRPEPVSTAFTIPIASPEEMAELASRHSGHPVLKLKLGSEDDPSRIAAVREARPDARLYVDANAAWSAQEATQRIRELEPYGLELVEQPVPREDIRGLGEVQARSSIPIVADESVQSMMDLEQLAAAGVRGVNLKLMKLGGIAPCRRLLRRAGELGLEIMLGCMVETSLGVSAMAAFMAQAEWIDLDGPLLVSGDPFEGLHYDEQARIHLPDRAGIGVRLRKEE